MGINLEKLAAALDKSGLNQADLAKKLGMDKGTISRWFAGKSEPEKVDKLKELAAVLGTTLAALTDDGDAAATAKERLLLDLFREAPEALGEAVLATLAASSPRKD